MTSLPTNFTVGSAMSASSVRDAIASYRRAQYLVAGSAIVSAAETDVFEDEDEDEESRLGYFDEHDEDDYYDSNDDDGESTTLQDGFVDQLQWDEDLAVSDLTMADAAQPPDMSHSTSPSIPASKWMFNPRADKGALKQSSAPWSANESTPLLSKKISFDLPPKARRLSTSSRKYGTQDRTSDFNAPSSASQRRLSNVSVRSTRSIARSIKYTHVGRSTFGQTLFNSIAILLGIGMLSEPLAFAYSGWIMGTIIIIAYGALSCYTAKILARIICGDPRLRSYADIGRKAFGPRATGFISFMFCLELFSVSVILVTLYADSLHTIIPTYSANTYKIWGILVLVPTVFLPLSLLSYTSMLGIVSTVLLVLVVFIDGSFKTQAPGSFWEPAETTLGVASASKLGIAFGLFMAGFAGHAVIPSLARDMIDPTQFDTMINWAFVVATLIYGAIGYAGYLMYGNNVSDEISVDMLNTPGYNPLLNQAALWVLVLNPLSKFALGTQPLNATLEILLGLDTPVPTPEHVARRPDSVGVSECRGKYVALKKVLAVIQRIVVTCAAVAVSIYIPEFSTMMAFLGSFSAFCLSIVGPIAAKAKLEGKCGVVDASIMVAGSVMAIWGTVAAFMD